MPFELLGNEKLTEVANVRLLAAEKNRLKEDAYLAGISMSALIRRRYFGRKIVADTDMIMIRELRRIGGLLKHIHNESSGAYSSQTAGMLVTVRAAIERISRDR